MTSAQAVFSIRDGAKSGKIGNCRADPLPQLLVQLERRAGSPCRFLRAVSRPWASALFQGRRHLIELVIEGEDAATRCKAFAEGLAEAEWSLPGHFIADILIDAVEPNDAGAWVTLSALSIEDW